MTATERALPTVIDVPRVLSVDQLREQATGLARLIEASIDAAVADWRAERAERLGPNEDAYTLGDRAELIRNAGDAADVLDMVAAEFHAAGQHCRGVIAEEAAAHRGLAVGMSGPPVPAVTVQDGATEIVATPKTKRTVITDWPALFQVIGETVRLDRVHGDDLFELYDLLPSDDVQRVLGFVTAAGGDGARRLFDLLNSPQVSTRAVDAVRRRLMAGHHDALAGRLELAVNPQRDMTGEWTVKRQPAKP